MKKKISIVVLYWNDHKKTIECLKSIFKQKGIKFSLVLVDNNSDKNFSDKVLKWIKSKKKKIFFIKKLNYIKSKYFSSSDNIFYIKNKANLGCGLGHNSGYRFCINNKFKYIARIDNDMIIPKTTIANLVKRLEKNRKIRAISPKIMYANNPNLIWWRGAKIDHNLKFQRNFGKHYEKGHEDNENFRGLINTDAIAGCASIMSVNKLKNVGLSDPDFFYGEEDVELSLRLKDNEDALKIDLNEKIYHHVSHTVGKNWAKNIYYNYKYRLVLIKKIGTNYDKFFGYLISIFKLIISIPLLFNKYYSSRFLQRYFAITHFFNKKYGNFDRENYLKINKYFLNINKQTNFFDIIKLINKFY
jgi:GT2 family glycosyltransferase